MKSKDPSIKIVKFITQGKVSGSTAGPSITQGQVSGSMAGPSWL